MNPTPDERRLVEYAEQNNIELQVVSAELDGAMPFAAAVSTFGGEVLSVQRTDTSLEDAVSLAVSYAISALVSRDWERMRELAIEFGLVWNPEKKTWLKP